jgi:hypothetical protein
VPLTGQVTLEHMGASGSSRVFLLKNGSSQRLTFRGFSPMLSDVEPVGYDVSCNLSAGSSVAALAPLVDGWYSPFSPREKTIEVEPAEQLRVAVYSEFFGPYKGNRCRLSLWLNDRSSVETGQFIP